MTWEMCQLLSTLGGIQLAIHLGGPQYCQKNKYCCSFGVWQTGDRIVRSPMLVRETKPDIFCEWNTKFSIIPEIPSKRVHSKRIPKFSKTLPGIFTVPFNFGPEISEFLVEWKAPRKSTIYGIKIDKSDWLRIQNELFAFSFFFIQLFVNYKCVKFRFKQLLSIFIGEAFFI